MLEKSTDQLGTKEPAPAPQAETGDSTAVDNTTITTTGETGYRPKHLLAITAGALALRLWFNFATSHPNAYSAADASEYLRYAAGLAAVTSGHAGAPMPEVLKEFIITGPALPVFLVLVSALTGQTFNAANSGLFLAAQSVISALTAGLIYLITAKLFDRRAAICAGVLAAIYPAFIVNCGRLYSETFGTFIECLAVLFLIQGFFPGRKIANNIFLGATLVAGQLTRSAMILFSVVSLPVVFLQGLFADGKKNWKQAFLSVSLVLTGMAILLAPWFIFEKAAYNKVSLTVDRVGHYNLFIGTNTATQGFLSYPYPDGRGIEQKNFGGLILDAAKRSPSRFLKLVLDKPARLLKAPWNDFRCPIGPFDYKMQVALHEAILLLGLIGIMLGALVVPSQSTGPRPVQSESEDELDEEIENESNNDAEAKVSGIQPAISSEPPPAQKAPAPIIWGRITLLLALALNMPYLAFITVPRYNLTAMPFFIIFAGAALVTVYHLVRSWPLARSPKAVPLFAIALYLYLRDDLRDVFTVGQEQTAQMVLVQGQDLLSKGLISLAFGIGLFTAVYFCISYLNGYRKLAKTLTVILAALTLPLLAVPQRANGRPGESIFTMVRPGERLLGTIPLKGEGQQQPPASQSATNGEWYLLIDCEDGTIFNGAIDLTVNGKKLTGPLIPGISALDDWHYLKMRSANTAYMECTYIYDCMTQPSDLSNLDLRQWYYLPLTPDIVQEARRRGCLNVTLDQRSSQPTKLFGASIGKAHSTIPTRDLYSWEKAFYGVENDSGLSDGRFDEVVPLRKARWQMSFGKNAEDLEHFDLNMRLLHLDAPQPQGETVTAQGLSTATLPLPDSLVKSGNLTLVRATVEGASNAKGQRNQTFNWQAVSPGDRSKTPSLALTWLDKTGKKVTLPLPWLKQSASTVDIAVPCDLGKIEGTNIEVTASDPVPGRHISLTAVPLSAHPVFGRGSLY